MSTPLNCFPFYPNPLGLNFRTSPKNKYKNSNKEGNLPIHSSLKKKTSCCCYQVPWGNRRITGRTRNNWKGGNLARLSMRQNRPVESQWTTAAERQARVLLLKNIVHLSPAQYRIRDIMEPVFQPTWAWSGAVWEAQHIYEQVIYNTPAILYQTPSHKVRSCGLSLLGMHLKTSKEVNLLLWFLMALFTSHRSQELEQRGCPEV